MRDWPIDPERVAALIDRRLDEHKRQELLTRLASSDEAFDVFVDAVTVTWEMQSAGLATEPASEYPGRRWRPARWVALAAVLAGAVLIPLLWVTTPRASRGSDPERFVALLQDRGAGLPFAWNDVPWPISRGSADQANPRAKAVRIGARLVDLELAVRAGDRSAGEVALEIATMLETVSGAAPAVAIYRELGGRSGEQPDRLDPLMERGAVAVVGLIAETDLLELGAWTEAARVAAARQDLEFFHTRETTDVLNRAVSLASLTGPEREAIRQIAMTARSETADWPAFERDLTELLGILGN